MHPAIDADVDKVDAGFFHEPRFSDVVDHERGVWSDPGWLVGDSL
jgi:hypothetical protein